METNENFENAGDNSTGTAVLGIREQRSFIAEIENEGAELGLNKSEYVKKILRDRHEGKREIERLTHLATEQQQEIAKLQAQIGAAGGGQFEVVNLELRKQIEALKNQLAIYSDKRLLYLFDHLKGKTDTVENAYGDNFPITYESAYEVLISIIYNSKLSIC